MNDDFGTVKNILTKIKSRYAAGCSLDVNDPDIQITERDIVADIRHSLTAFCTSNGYHVHCEIRPASDETIEPDEMKKLPRIDVVVLQDRKGDSWLAAAKKLQDKYQKSSIEARFSSIPIRFFHTAIEAKIQSNVTSAKKDIDTLKKIEEKNPSCNCFFVLLNARGRVQDHDNILKYGKDRKIIVIEYTAKRQNPR
jgi:hypothetical protein